MFSMCCPTHPINLKKRWSTFMWTKNGLSKQKWTFMLFLTRKYQFDFSKVKNFWPNLCSLSLFRDRGTILVEKLIVMEKLVFGFLLSKNQQTRGLWNHTLCLLGQAFYKSGVHNFYYQFFLVTVIYNTFQVNLCWFF